MDAAGKIRTLLYRSESDDLDFKAEQYKLSGKDRDKGEFLKDMLAFANAWREGDAHIVLGVKEVKGKQPEVVGITNAYDDAHLQQLVRSHLDPSLRFSYQCVELDGKMVGLITIPKQERPFCVRKSAFGLDPQEVYVRHGSSTSVATPKQVAAMGKADSATVRREPPVIKLMDEAGRSVDPGTVIKMTVTTPTGAIPNFTEADLSEPKNIHASVNYDYWRELVRYRALRAACVSLQLSVQNKSTEVVRSLKAVVTVEGVAVPVHLLTGVGPAPLQQHISWSNVAGLSMTFPPKAAVKPDQNRTNRLEVRYLEDLLPGDTAYLPPFFLTSETSTSTTLAWTLYGDGLPVPERGSVDVHLEVQKCSRPYKQLL